MLLPSLLVALPAVAALVAPPPAPPPPHILLIVADDLGYNDVSWHNPALVTPHLETLAR